MAHSWKPIYFCSKNYNQGQTHRYGKRNYGFNQSAKNYIDVYYGTPDNCKLIWEQGDNLPIGDQ